MISGSGWWRPPIAAQEKRWHDDWSDDSSSANLLANTAAASHTAVAGDAEGAPRMFFAGALTPASQADYPVGGSWSDFFSQGSWQGLYCRDVSCSLRPATAAVRESSTKDCRGKRVPVSRLALQPAQPLLLVDGLARTSGPVRTLLFDAQGRELPSGAATSMDGSPASGWEVRLQLPDRESQGDECVDTRTRPIELQVAGRMQSRWSRQICVHRPSVDGEFAVHWVGDLDRDGKWDVLLRFPDGTVKLLLSAQPSWRLESRHEFPNAGC